jgi:hypothetical protein
MRNVRTIAAGIGIAGALGIAALGIGAGTASAAPPSPVAHGDFAEWGGPGRGPWGHGGGPWYPPPPPPPAYGYGYSGYAPPPPCISGPLGFLQFCP